MRDLISAWGAILIASLMLLAVSASAEAAPNNFEQAKLLLRQNVYHDRERSDLGDFYCGCKWSFHKRNASGGKTDLGSCGYQVRAQPQRAERIEWEHIMPAHSFGQQRQCWQKGGRKNCVDTDPVFSKMEADMHNLTVAVGEVNADRSNFRFSPLPGTPKQHGQCDVKIDFKQRAAEPRDEVKGMVARTYFYMHDRYQLRMSDQQARLFMAWDKTFPVSEWERERSRRIARYMGHENPFVTGHKTWSASGVIERNNTGVSPTPQIRSENREQRAPERVREPVQLNVDPPVHIKPIIGNQQSQIYHLPECPSYDKVSERNQVFFHLEAHAIDAGYRKAKNCP